MFGLPSLPKLLVLAAIIAAVIYGFRWVGRVQKDRERVAKEAKKKAKAAPERDDARLDAEEMVQCPKCGVYLASTEVKDCGKENCPYP